MKIISFSIGAEQSRRSLQRAPTRVALRLYILKVNSNIESFTPPALPQTPNQISFYWHSKVILFFTAGSRSKNLLKLVENFCETLTRSAPYIESLHLPVLSDKSAQYVSMLGSLKKLTVERLMVTKGHLFTCNLFQRIFLIQTFSARGIYSFCRNSSRTAHHLEELILPITTNRWCQICLSLFPFFQSRLLMKCKNTQCKIPFDDSSYKNEAVKSSTFVPFCEAHSYCCNWPDLFSNQNVIDMQQVFECWTVS